MARLTHMHDPPQVTSECSNTIRSSTVVYGSIFTYMEGERLLGLAISRASVDRRDLYSLARFVAHCSRRPAQ